MGHSTERTRLRCEVYRCWRACSCEVSIGPPQLADGWARGNVRMFSHSELVAERTTSDCPFPFLLSSSSFKYDIPYYHTVIFLLYSYYIPRMNCRHFGLCFFFQHPFFNPRASSFLKVDSSLCSRSQITSPSSIVIHPSLRNNFIYANLSKCRFHCTQVLSYASLSAEEV